MATLLERNHAAALLDQSSAAAVRVENLWKKYGALEAVRGVSLNVKQGEIFGLIGPDGAGKTTTFQILGGVMEATSGVTEIYGKPAREARSQTGYLTQSFSLYPDLTVAENIRYIGDLRRVPPEEIAGAATATSACSTWTASRNRLAGRLSGGMKQKLSLVARWWRSRACCCSTSRPPASIRSRAANSGTRSRISRPKGSPSWWPRPISTKPSAATAWP